MAILLLTAVSSCVLAVGAALLLQQLAVPIPIVGQFIELTLSRNRGIAFSILLPSPWQELLVISAFCIVCFIALRTPLTKLLSVAFGLIIGGAIANLLDRLVTGAVTDYIAVGRFPVFNLADVAIAVGACLLLLETWMKRETGTLSHRP